MEIQSIKNRFGIIGSAPALNYAITVASQVANTDLTVLIMGESGVGKEAFSHIIHNLSARKHNPFIAVNCGAIPEGTIDSELFGHEKGAFTGAVDNRKGYFETVNGGTIFLDEIGEMPIGTQARLLRVLETGEFIRVGSSKVQKTNVRVIAATNRELINANHLGRFREDLYYRLNTVPIRVPALRDRKEDIPLLFRKFAADFSEKYKMPSIHLDAQAFQLLCNYAWPGNIRELKNMAEQISVLSIDKNITSESIYQYIPKIVPSQNNNYLPVLTAMNQQPFDTEFAGADKDLLYKLFFDLKKDISDLKKLLFEMAHQQGFTPGAPFNEASLPNSYPATNEFTNPVSINSPILLHPSETAQAAQFVEENLQLAEREKEFIIKSLKKHKGRRNLAAQELGISERTLYRKIKEFGIEE
jgi:transcriptional regulator with PAS, ATPase and Fis domain